MTTAYRDPTDHSPDCTSESDVATVPEFVLHCGALRRRWQWVGVMVAVLVSITFWWPLTGGHEAGTAFWLGQGGLILAAGLWWRRLHPAGAGIQCLQYSSGRWWHKAPSTNHLWRLIPEKADGRATVVILPGVVVLNRGRLWLFPDELSPDDWRRLNVCARFGAAE